MASLVLSSAQTAAQDVPVLLESGATEPARPLAPLPTTPGKDGRALIKRAINIVPATSTEKGEGIAGIDGLRATFYVGCTPKETEEMLWDISRFQEIFPDIQRLKVLKRTKTQIDAEFGIDVKVAWVSYTLRRHLNSKARRIWWEELGGDLNHVRGEWRLWPTADPNVTKVRYSSFVEVSAFVPTSMIRDGALGAVKKLPEKVRRGCAATRAKKAAQGGAKP